MAHIFTPKLFQHSYMLSHKIDLYLKEVTVIQVFKLHNLNFKYTELKPTFLQFGWVPRGRKLTQSHVLSFFPSVIKF